MRLVGGYDYCGGEVAGLFGRGKWSRSFSPVAKEARVFGHGRSISALVTADTPKPEARRV